MSQLKDPAIKLFGKTIQLLHPDHLLPASTKTWEKEEGATATTQTEETCSNQNTEEFISQSTSSGINDDPKTPTSDKETSSKNTQKKDNPITNSSSEEKPPKPDTILPCPRCNSMETKFCYYNNYNVNQPRHFCKNCQRYWTAGGTMRNTPVGSGRRKNKSSSSSSYYRHLIVSESPNSNSCVKTNGSVVNFGSDVPLCESMNSALNFSDKSQMTTYPVQIPCYPPPPWPYSAQFRPPSGFPVSFYPPPHYWGCTVQVQPNPWVGNDQIAPTSPLGKHSRDGNLVSPSSTCSRNQPHKDVLIPKTLRIKDLNESAKSSIWSTLGISKDESGNNLHKAFQPKSDVDKNEVVATSLVNNLQANPAALSRSLNFRETT